MNEGYWYEMNFGHCEDPDSTYNTGYYTYEEQDRLTDAEEAMKNFITITYGVDWKYREFEDIREGYRDFFGMITNGELKHFNTRAYISREYGVSKLYWESNEYRWHISDMKILLADLLSA